VDRGAAPVDLGGDGAPELVLSCGQAVLVLDARTGATRLEQAIGLRPDDRQEDVSSAPLVGDLDGDGQVELFVVCGRGYSGDLQPRNFGRAMLLRLGPGKGAWTTFRGGLRRLGRAGR
jgi:hypothetical protein